MQTGAFLRIRKCPPLLAAGLCGMFAVAPAAAQEGTATLGDLLKQGFEIKSTDLIPQDIGRRASGQEWEDGLLITLQKGPDIAFCNFMLSVTINPSNMLAAVCSLAR